jgi:hypothetical protein
MQKLLIAKKIVHGAFELHGTGNGTVDGRVLVTGLKLVMNGRDRI